MHIRENHSPAAGYSCSNWGRWDSLGILQQETRAPGGVWTFCQCWKDLPISLSAFPKTWVMAVPHSHICNCLFSLLEIYINPAQVLLSTHLMPLPSMYFVFMCEISTWAWYRNSSFSKSFSINQDQLGWMFLQAQLLQRQSLYVWGYTKRLPVLTQSVSNKIWSSVQATYWLLRFHLTQEMGTHWNPSSSVNNVFLQAGMWQLAL